MHPHLKPAIETSKGHLQAFQSTIRSTKGIDSSAPISTKPDKRFSEFYSKIIKPSGKVHSDQNGKCKVTSSKGSKHNDHDSNAILPEALKSKSVNNHLHAIKTTHAFLFSKGITPCVHVMDN